MRWVHGTKQFTQEIFTFYNTPGEYEVNWKVFKGNEAEREKRKIFYHPLSEYFGEF